MGFVGTFTHLYEHALIPYCLMEKWTQHGMFHVAWSGWASRDCVAVSKEFSIKKNRTSKLKQLLLMLLTSPLCVMEVLGWEVGTHQNLTESQSYTWWIWTAGVCFIPADPDRVTAQGWLLSGGCAEQAAGCMLLNVYSSFNYAFCSFPLQFAALCAPISIE